MIKKLYKAMWSVKEGWYLRWSRYHGWEWLPSPSLLNVMIDRGEIG